MTWAALECATCGYIHPYEDECVEEDDGLLVEQEAEYRRMV